MRDRSIERLAFDSMSGVESFVPVYIASSAIDGLLQWLVIIFCRLNLLRSSASFFLAAMKRDARKKCITSSINQLLFRSQIRNRTWQEPNWSG